MVMNDGRMIEEYTCCFLVAGDAEGDARDYTPY
jgi:hypothetical protein